MLFGVLVHRVQKKSYYKLTIGVETGYNVDLYTIRICNNSPEISVGDQVAFDGYFITKDCFYLYHINKEKFPQCSECNVRPTSNECFIQHDKEAKKLDGEWCVVHKILREGVIKIFFEKEHFVFAAVATKKHWYYHIFEKLTDADSVSINGWRYKNNTSIKNISKNK